MNYTLRKFELKDKTKVLNLEREGLLLYFQKHVNGGLTKETQEKWLNECLTSGFIKIIEIEEKFAGFISCKSIENKILHINGIHIKKEFQNKKIGQEVINYLLEKVKKLGYKYLSLYVFKDNFVSLHIYEKLGFTFYKDITNEYTVELRKKL